MIRCLMVPVAAAMMASVLVSVLALGGGAAYAQGAFPGSPGQPASGSAFPPVNGSSSSGATFAAPPGSMGAPSFGGGGFGAPPPPQAGSGAGCMNDFTPLREERDRRGKAAEALMASAKAKPISPDEACKVLGAFARAQAKVAKFVEANAARCGIPPQIGERMTEELKKIEAGQKNACNAAQQVQQRGPAGPSLSDILGSSSVPEVNPVKKGGSAFDTLNGNILSR